MHTDAAAAALLLNTDAVSEHGFGQRHTSSDLQYIFDQMIL
jgi:hypothetical protein